MWFYFKSVKIRVQRTGRDKKSTVEYVPSRDLAATLANFNPV
jgi:hypothetical protein